MKFKRENVTQLKSTTMKAKTFLLLFLFFGTGLAQLFAQQLPPPDNKQQTGTVHIIWEGNLYLCPVATSPGEATDWLFGYVEIHCIQHFKDGVWLWEHTDFKGEVVSVGIDFNGGSGEMFQINDHWTTHTPFYGGTGRLSAVGSLGTRYIIFYEFDTEWNFTCTKVIKG